MQDHFVKNKAISYNRVEPKKVNEKLQSCPKFVQEVDSIKKLDKNHLKLNSNFAIQHIK